MMEDYKVLTPQFRQDINKGISEQMQELNTCQNNALINAQKTGLRILSDLINSLPDGFLIPVNKR